MGYRISFGTTHYDFSDSYFTEQLVQSQTTIREEGLQMVLDDVFSKHFHFTWGQYHTTQNRLVTEEFNTPSIVTHFPLSVMGSKPTRDAVDFYLFHQQPQPYGHHMEACRDNKEHLFFEYALPLSFFDRFVTAESYFLDTFSKSMATGYTDKTYRSTTTPAMRALISSLRDHEYSGNLKEIFLELKATELFLLQIKELDKKPADGKLSKKDIQRLHDARIYIENHFDQPCSIIDLSQKVGINQTKLKAGFKELFGNTVFGYLRDLQMEKARHLLLEEQLFVGEVADRIGYKHPHHFTAAFKRKFGILPSELKS